MKKVCKKTTILFYLNAPFNYLYCPFNWKNPKFKEQKKKFETE